MLLRPRARLTVRIILTPRGTDSAQPEFLSLHRVELHIQTVWI